MNPDKLKQIRELIKQDLVNCHPINYHVNAPDPRLFRLTISVIGYSRDLNITVVPARLDYLVDSSILSSDPFLYILTKTDGVYSIKERISLIGISNIEDILGTSINDSASTIVIDKLLNHTTAKYTLDKESDIWNILITVKRPRQ